MGDAVTAVEKLLATPDGLKAEVYLISDLHYTAAQAALAASFVGSGGMSALVSGPRLERGGPVAAGCAVAP